MYLCRVQRILAWLLYVLFCDYNIVHFLQSALYFNYFTVFLTVRNKFKQPHSYNNINKTKNIKSET